MFAQKLRGAPIDWRLLMLVLLSWGPLLLLVVLVVCHDRVDESGVSGVPDQSVELSGVEGVGDCDGVVLLIWMGRRGLLDVLGGVVVLGTPGLSNEVSRHAGLLG